MSFVVSGVGLLLLLTALLKAIDIKPFVRHVSQLLPLPEKAGVLLAFAFVELEAALGMALLLQLALKSLLPLAVAGLLLGTLLTVWGVGTGRVQHCGCYGNFIQVPLFFSVGLNALMVLLLLVAFPEIRQSASFPAWSILLVMAVIGLGGFLMKQSARHPLVNLSRVKEGRFWVSSWLAPPLEMPQESTVLIVLSADCSACESWLLPLTTLATAPARENLIALVGEGAEYLAELREVTADQTGCIVSVPDDQIGRLSRRLPLAARIVGGRIEKTWSGPFPLELIERG